MKYILTIIAAIFIFSCTQSSKEKSKSYSKELDNYSSLIDSMITTTNPRIFNGVIHITKGGELKYSKAYGYSNFDKKTPISINDKFRIMSNSKQITAVLLLKEVEKGSVNLNSPIGEYLENLTQDWKNDVTVHQLLNMSSGIVDIEKPLIFVAGKGYRYSNPGYGLLGRIIEKASGQDYKDLANNMFTELGMDNTYCYELNKPNIGLIDGYDLKEKALKLVAFDSLGITEEEWKDFIPAGGIISTAHDLNIWDTKLHKAEIIDITYQELMTNPSNSGPHAAFDNDTIGYAYGIRVHDQHAVYHLGHGGRGFGFVSIKFYIPEKDVDVIIWENIYCRDQNVMAGEIVYHFENEIRKIILNSNLVK